MPNYQNGKIYKIHSFQTDNIYIGSTTQPLCKRFVDHKFKFKQGIKGPMSKKILIYDDAMITLIENYPCNDRNELEKRERFQIENNNCVNKCIPTRTSKEYRDSNKDKLKQYQIDNKDKLKQYRLDNKDKIKEQHKQFFIDNKDYTKQYLIDNKDKIKQRHKQYYINNTEKIKEYKKQYLIDNRDNTNNYQQHKRSHFGIICKSYGIFH